MGQMKFLGINDTNYIRRIRDLKLVPKVATDAECLGLFEFCKSAAAQQCYGTAEACLATVQDKILRMGWGGSSETL